jgi:hypothetical protein
MKIIEVTTPALRKEFAFLPFRLYQGNPYWVPPILKSEINNINPAGQSFFFVFAMPGLDSSTKRPYSWFASGLSFIMPT